MTSDQLWIFFASKKQKKINVLFLGPLFFKKKNTVFKYLWSHQIDVNVALIFLLQNCQFCSRLKL